MALKFKVAARDDIPEEQRAFYVERDGVWLLDVEGAVEKAKLDEFRSNNTALLRQLDEHKKRFEGIDPDEVRKLAEEKQRLEEEKLLAGGDRIKGLKAEWEKQVNTLTAERENLNARLTAIQIDQGVITAATKRGLRPTALTDITARTMCAWTASRLLALCVPGGTSNVELPRSGGRVLPQCGRGGVSGLSARGGVGAAKLDVEREVVVL